MSNATRWYTTREAVKSAVGISGSSLNALIDGYIEAASEEAERITHRNFIPITAAKSYPWPQRDGHGSALFLREDLLAVTSLTKDGTGLTAIASTDYFLEPSDLGPPYSRIEIDFASSAFFSSLDTPQRAIVVTGRWGYCEDTKAAGALAEADDGSETVLDVTNEALIDAGDTILIGAEAMFVSGKGSLDSTANTAGALTASKSETAVAVNTGTLVNAGETILIDSERMYVESVSGNNLTVIRAYDGSTLASHANPSDVYVYRSLTVARGVNGTTAASHSTSAAITKYAPPRDLSTFCLARAISLHEQGRSGWTGQMGGGEAAVESRLYNLRKIEDSIRQHYKRRVGVAV